MLPPDDFSLTLHLNEEKTRTLACCYTLDIENIVHMNDDICGWIALGADQSRPARSQLIFCCRTWHFVTQTLTGLLACCPFLSLHSPCAPPTPHSPAYVAWPTFSQ